MTRHIPFIAALLPACVAAAQQAAPKDQPPAQPAPRQEQPAQPPTLDELLGITPDKPAPKAKTPPQPAQDPSKSALDRKLSDQEVSQAFLQAITLMDETATRLESSRDIGITTQRMQEDVVRKLDLLISQAQRQQRQRQRPQSQPNNQDPSSQNQQQQQQDQSQQEPAGNTENRGQVNPPGRQEGPLGPQMPQGAAWGALPERVREALMQGTADKYSATWQRLTEAYFRKIAEEAGK